MRIRPWSVTNSFAGILKTHTLSPLLPLHHSNDKLRIYNTLCCKILFRVPVSPFTQCIHSFSEGKWSQPPQSACKLAYGRMLLDTISVR